MWQTVQNQEGPHLQTDEVHGAQKDSHKLPAGLYKAWKAIQWEKSAKHRTQQTEWNYGEKGHIRLPYRKIDHGSVLRCIYQIKTLTFQKLVASEGYPLQHCY